MAGKLTNTMGQDGVGAGRKKLQSSGPKGPISKNAPAITPSKAGKVARGHGHVDVGARPNSSGKAPSHASDPKRGMPREQTKKY